MKTNLYSIYDTASGVYSKPWQGLTDAQAMREFQDIVAMPDKPIGAHPEDYYLCRIGTFDDNNAKLKPENRTTLLTGLEAVAMLNQQANETFEIKDPSLMMDIRPNS